MTEANDAPPLDWLWSGTERRRRFLQYWFLDTPQGLLNVGVHHALTALPTDLCSAIGAVLGPLTGKLRYREGDARARAAWVRFRPQESDAASVDAAMAYMWRQTGRVFTEYSAIHRFWKEGRITVEGIEHLDAMRLANRPRLVVGLHLGNWETIANAMIAFGHTGTGVYHPPDNRFEHRLIVDIRHRYGAKLFPAGRVGTRAALRALQKREEAYLIYIDEFLDGRVFAPSFGRELRAEGNIAHCVRLAAMTGADPIPAYSVRLGETARFHVRFLPPVKMLRTEDKESDIMANIAKLDRVIEPIVREYLDQWYFLTQFRFDN